jgi:hypothetical protein
MLFFDENATADESYSYRHICRLIDDFSWTLENLFGGVYQSMFIYTMAGYLHTRIN